MFARSLCFYPFIFKFFRSIRVCCLPTAYSWVLYFISVWQYLHSISFYIHLINVIVDIVEFMLTVSPLYFNILPFVPVFLLSCFFLDYFNYSIFSSYIYVISGVPGWLTRVSVWLGLRSPSRDFVAGHWQCGARLGFSLPAPPPLWRMCSHTLSLSK